ncbi:MAG: epoxyqueuosine reductase [Candidatus Tectomicrobia bacterium]|uniref:Epoxyqueuosine reductase n=1 Tax=Tectimicrobiota bacterium TaxID=2528274 RepID=A0A932GQY6_UNCTE|nr:epoxyqueuosine reductase [Candidatus Tectomicrobia bacterium]
MTAELTSRDVKEKARELGADLVGIVAGVSLNANPPDPKIPQTPERITPDSKSVIVLAKAFLRGTSRLKGKNDRHKQYSAELQFSELEEISLRLVYFLEDHGYPSITVPPMHNEALMYRADGRSHGPLSLPHAAVEAGLGTLGLNLMLLTPEYGPRVLLGAVLTSADLEPDSRMETALCLGEECGRCLLTCPGDAVLHWGLDAAKCAPHASPYGFEFLLNHMENIVKTPEKEKQLALLRSAETFNAWQSILRGVGVYTGCTRCVDVCPVGKDYEAHIKSAQEEIPEETPQKRARLAEMLKRRRKGDPIVGLEASRRWIGNRP